MVARLGDMADDELLDRFAAGDAAAFAVLVQRYQRPLYNFVLRTVRDTDAAADLLQEAFARVVTRAGEFRRGSKFSTWLYAIARNLCIDHARRMKHRRHASLDVAPAALAHAEGASAALLDRIAGAEPDTERQASSAGLRSRIEAAVANLPEEQREVFLMRELQQMPFAEIASIVGVSENTIKSRMRYALERLQQALADYEEYARVQA